MKQQFWVILFFVIGFVVNAKAVSEDKHFFIMSQNDVEKFSVIEKPKVLSAHGELALVQMAPAQVNRLAELIHHDRPVCGGFRDIQDAVDTMGLSAEQTFLILASGGSLQPMGGMDVPQQIDHMNEIQSVLAKVSQTRFLDLLQKLTSFSDRYSNSATGESASDWLKNKAVEIAKLYGRNDVTTETFNTSMWYSQKSVVIKIPGTNAKLPGVLIGGHMDTYPGNKPGVDDDASGSVTALEVFAALLESGVHFQRDIYLAFYAAEEVGLVGSGVMAREFRSRGVELRGVMQFDMVGFRSPNDSKQVWYVRDHANDALTEFTKQLGEKVLGFTMATQGDLQCGYACSDHASWTDQGYLSVFPFETDFHNYNQYIHTERDNMSLFSIDHAMKYARLGAAFMTEMAEPVK